MYVVKPIEICEQRDRKALYAKARAGALKEFTGVSDPYEAPVCAEITLNTRVGTPEQEAETVLIRLIESGFIQRFTV